MSGGREPDRLGALAGADVQDPDRSVGQVRRQLPADQLLPQHVAQIAQPGQPQFLADRERPIS